MNCVFANRRGDNGMDFETFFTDMTVVASSGQNNSQGTGAVYIPASAISSLSGVGYIFSIANWKGAISVWKVKNGVVQTTPLIQTVARYAAVAVNTTNGNIYFYQVYHESPTTTGQEGNHTLVLVRFPSYSEQSVDFMLTKATWSNLYTKMYDPSEGIRAYELTDFNHKVILANKSRYFDVWLPEPPNLMKKVSGTLPIPNNNAAYLYNPSGQPPYLYIAGYAYTLIALD